MKLSWFFLPKAIALIFLMGLFACGGDDDDMASPSPTGDDDTETAPTSTPLVDDDNDGSAIDQDCDDGDDQVYPGADEICDDKDNDCDSEIDEGLTQTYYLDEDSDGYGLSSSTIEACSLPDGYAETSGDCNDSLESVNPGAAEMCNGIDDDCDTYADDADPQGAEDMTVFYLDADSDTYGIDIYSKSYCTATYPYLASEGGDCDDTDPQVRPGATEAAGDGIDQDCDGTELCYKDADDDGYRPSASATVVSDDTDCEDPGEANGSGLTGDCNDDDGDVNPDASEIAGDGVDQNCDEAELCYLDADNDGFRPDEGSTVASSDADCSDGGEALGDAPIGDCDDSSSPINPNAEEIAGDGVDQNCDSVELCYLDSDNDGYRPDTGETLESSDLDCSDDTEASASASSGDCDDSNSAVHPGATEVAGDSVDQDCDGIELCYLDADDDGYRPDSSSTVSSSNIDCSDTTEAAASEPTGDCNDSVASIYPGADEITGDEIDQDCDGSEICYADIDNDGYRPDSGDTVNSGDSDCEDASEASANVPTGDCDDSVAAVNPAADEVVGDGVDQDCDGEELCYMDTDDDGYRPDSSSTVTSRDTDCDDVSEALDTDSTGDCDDSNSAINPGATELPGDNVDQDCDGGELCYSDADNDDFRPDDSTVSSTDTDCNDTAEATDSVPDGDCDDSNPDINPDATEATGDGVDQDCDGTEMCYVDADDDGYRPDSSSEVASSDTDCEDTGEAMLNEPVNDCRDDDSSINPGAEEVCDDGVDNNCDDAPCLSGSLALTSADAKLVGEASNDNAGGAISSAGDVNGDGYDDILVGAAGEDSGGNLAGAAYLIHGPVSGVVDLGEADAKITGENEEDRAGRAVGAGDLNGDGYADILVGAYNYDTTASNAGAAYILYGPVEGTVDLADAGAKLTGEAEDDWAGFSLASAGDVDGDGNDDILVGAYNQDTAGDNAGAAYLLYGPVEGELSLADADCVFDGVAADDRAGFALSSAGDVNNDGYDDIVIGAYNEGTAADNAGAAYLFLGPVSGSHSLSEADATLTGEAAGDLAGGAVSAAGDVNGDGYGDLLVGAYSENSGGDNAGAAYLLFGPISDDISLSEADAKLIGEAQGDRAGFAVAGAGDVNGDGYDDLVIGADRASNGSVLTGAAYLVYGPVEGSLSLGDADAKFTGEAQSDGAGHSVAFGGDIDGDLLNDFLVGAYYEDSGGTLAGAAYVILGRGL